MRLVGCPVLVAVLALGLPGFVLNGSADDQEGDVRPVLMAQTGVGPVHDVAMSPDGRYVVTGGNLRLWEAATGRAVRDFKGQVELVLSVAFSADGRHVLTGALDNTARLWETATAKEVTRFEGHESPVASVAFSPDGRHVLTGSHDGTARLWKTDDGSEALSIEAHEAEVTSVAYASDGRYVVTGSMDGTAREWRPDSGAEVQAFRGENGRVLSVAVSPDARQVLTGQAGTWDDQGEPLSAPAALLWDEATGKVVQRFLGHEEPIHSVAFSADGRHVLTAAYDGTARLWDRASGDELRSVEETETDLLSAAFASDGRKLLTSSHGFAVLWDPERTERLRRFEGETTEVSSAVYTADGRHLLTASWDGAARLWKTDMERGVRRFEGSGEMVAAALSPDGRLLFAGGSDGSARLWDVATKEEVWAIGGGGGSVASVAFTPDGEHVLTGCEGAVDDEDEWIERPAARLYDVETGREVKRYVGHDEAILAVAVSPDGAYVLTASDDGTARLWDFESEEEVRVYEGHEESVMAAAFSADGRRVLTASWDGTARIWDTKTGSTEKVFKGGTEDQEAHYLAVAFSPDGQHVLTGGWDTTVRLWDVGTGEEVQLFEGHEAEVESVAFSPDGRHVLSGAIDNTLRLWDARSGSERCRLLGFGDGSWAVIDSEGRYDASNGGDVDGLHWVVGSETISLDQLKERYYEPGLLAKILGHNDEPLREVAALTAPKLYPSLNGRVREDGKIEIRLGNRGGGLGRVVVMVNGKERSADARGPGVDPHVESLTLVEDLRDDPRLLPGEENKIEVFAYNEEGYLRSRGLVLAVKAEGKVEPPNLWAIVAGVADYRGRLLDLQFPNDDAAAFAGALEVASRGLFGVERTHVKLLTNAKRAELLDALEWAKKARAADILVVYLAGHGVNHGEGFYFMTADAQSAEVGDPDVWHATTLASGDLTQAITEIPALKQVLILDTCASGKFIEALTGRRAVPSSQVRALERVKDRTGMFVLAGCAADRVSYEASRYGQGLLTYSLLLGMKGGELREKQFVDVAALFGFAADRVPEFAKDIGGVQRPVVAQPRGGQSFDIGRLPPEAQREIPLRAARPFFSQSSLRDVEEDDDVLYLSDQVDAAMTDEAARGNEARLVFVAERRFPGAYRLTGSYTSTNGRTKLEFRLRRDTKAVTGKLVAEAPAAELPGLVLERVLEHLPAQQR